METVRIFCPLESHSPRVVVQSSRAGADFSRECAVRESEPLALGAAFCLRRLYILGHHLSGTVHCGINALSIAEMKIIVVVAAFIVFGSSFRHIFSVVDRSCL